MSAYISPDGRYRYTLVRDLGNGVGTCNFVMLNPSTADAVKDDPTVRRCIGYAKLWGCDRLIVTNIFAYRATNPGRLYNLTEAEAVGPENDYWLQTSAESARYVVCGWGDHGRLHDRGARVRKMMKGLPMWALKVNMSGEPVHPLYQPKLATLKPI